MEIEQIPGTLLDVQVGVTMFERTYTKFPRGWCWHDGSKWIEVEPYSTTWEGMQMVVEEMLRRGWDWQIYINSKGDFCTEFSSLEDGLGVFGAAAVTAPGSCALAAIKAIGVT